MKPYNLFILLVAMAAISCSKESVDTDIQIRIENASIYEMESIKVLSFGEEYNYGDLAPGQVSDYQVIQRAFSYAYIELTIDGEIYALQPVDFVGETELGGGTYTYILDADDSTDKFNRLSFAFRED